MTNSTTMNSGMSPRVSTRLGLALAIGIATASAQAADPVIYNQPRATDPGFRASQNDTGPQNNGNYATTYDNFSFQDPVTVTDVHWSGGYFNPPNQGSITAFTVQFWSDNSGQPGSSLRSENHLGNAGEAAGLACSSNPCFDYSIILDSPFHPVAGTTYWLSIVADLAVTPQWGWATGTGGDGIAYQDFFGTRSSFQNDMAFQLTGCRDGSCNGTVPEPATLALLGLGLTGMALMRRRSAR